MATVGECIVTYGNVSPSVRKPARSIRWAWTSDAAGNASGDDCITRKINGTVVVVVTVPALAGDAPSAAYDIVVLDEDGRDVLAGSGANRSASAVESSGPTAKQPVDDQTLQLQVSNAGDTNQGVVIVYYE